MRNLILAAVAAALIPAGALAADFPYASPEQSYVPADVPSWTGFYAGAHVGYGFGDVDDADADGFLGGLQAGFDWQMEQLVVGVEGDVAYTGMGYDGIADGFDVDWFGTVRGRIGYAFDRFMVFGTGGLAWANAEYETAGGSDEATYVGWTAGAGVEAMITDTISAKADYLYSSFGEEDFPAATGDELEFDMHAVRLGVNYRF